MEDEDEQLQEESGDPDAEMMSVMAVRRSKSWEDDVQRMNEQIKRHGSSCHVAEISTSENYIVGAQDEVGPGNGIRPDAK